LNKKKVIGIIPVRLESKRLPKKALKNICGLPMIIHVLKRCEMAELLDNVYVATDNMEIKSIVEDYNGKVLMTKNSHLTGTDRIAEASDLIDTDIVVNIQGDEALVQPNHIDKVTQILIDDESVNVGLLVNSFFKKQSQSDIKVVLNKFNEVLYLSRNDIPNVLKNNNTKMLKAYHIVPFRKSFLKQFTQLERGPLEIIERNEYLRILENGYSIKTVEVESSAISVDTPSDLEFVRKKMILDPLFKKYSQI
jgi:3-deoxy-manno-octulosonate cytidylyltransferase (CMP-KDO synthetase)